MQLNGNLATEKVVIEQEVVSDECVDAFLGISQSKDLLRLSGVARTWTEVAQGMLVIVDLDVHHSLPNVRCDDTHAMVLVAPGAM